ncbi:WbqC family protein [Halobacteriovorax sp. XZX-3]|uniref:WbqC family protein n=1 Tax=unclassified Halobacteriovorax TaxID=2639665 RepID=UPI0037249817
MQPYFLPYIGYFRLISKVDYFVIFDDVNYIKRGWINRNYFSINGEAKLLTLKVKKASINKKINELFLLDDSVEEVKKTLQQSYNKNPFSNEVIDRLLKPSSLFDNKLSHYLSWQLQEISSYLSLDAKFICSSSLNILDELRGQDRVIEICKVLGATEYFNLPGGRSLYEVEKFKESRIELTFLPELGDLDSKLSFFDTMTKYSVNDLTKMIGVM